MKHLFAIRNTRTKKLVPGLFFESKPAAKKERDARNAIEESPVFVVTYGPDHRLFTK